jgi:hypothetical protein
LPSSASRRWRGCSRGKTPNDHPLPAKILPLKHTKSLQFRSVGRRLGEDSPLTYRMLNSPREAGRRCLALPCPGFAGACPAIGLPRFSLHRADLPLLASTPARARSRFCHASLARSRPPSPARPLSEDLARKSPAMTSQLTADPRPQLSVRHHNNDMKYER